jgi:hypothetical protein
MERWTLNRYEQPYLAVSAVRVEPDTRELVLVAGQNEYALEQEGGDPAEIADRLRALRSPSAPLWRQLRTEPDTPAWTSLLDQMDVLGLLRDAAADRREQESRDLRELEEAVRAAVAAALAAASPADREGLRDGLARVLACVEPLLRQVGAEVVPGAPGTEAAAYVSPLDAFKPGNFYLRTLLAQAHYLRRSAPLSLTCNVLAMHGIARELGMAVSEADAALARALLGELAAGVYSLRDVRNHLGCVDYFLVRSARAEAALRARSGWQPMGRKPGLTFMLEMEQAALELAAQMGTPRFLKAVRAPDAPLSLAQGCYLEEYHVTCRFVEILTPMLGKRLREPLRRRMFRYYAEEVGHEAFEMASCRSLGIPDEYILNSRPLPLHVAYVDIFTHLAEVSPVGYFVSLFITEGFLGTASPLEEPMKRLTQQEGTFAEGAGKHAALNEEYNHTSLSRLFMAEVPSVGEQTQALAFSYMHLLLELNHRAWDGVLEAYASGAPWLKGVPNAA